MKLVDAIDRRAGVTRNQFEREYLQPLRPVVMTDAIDHWNALGQWSPKFFKAQYGHLRVKVDGDVMTLGELIDRIGTSTDEHPAPYLRNQLLSDWPPELWADVSPMPDCTQPNWLESRLFPTRTKLSSVEVYIGGTGAKFPVLHYDNWHTHAFLMQLYGEKEYIAFSPKQSASLYPRPGIERNKSQIDDLLNPNVDAFPLCARAEGIRFRLGPGETLFVPSGWWHTARILSPSVTVSINSVNKANATAFRHDYVESLGKGSRLRNTLVVVALSIGEATLLFERI